MSQKSKQGLRQTNQQNFPNNNSAFITPEKLRDFNNDIIDSMAIDVDTQLSGSISVTGSINVSNNITASGHISASTYYGDGSNLTGVIAQPPAGTISGSSQVILTDTTGNLGGNRITGSVSNAVSSSYAVSASRVQVDNQPNFNKEHYLTWVDNTDYDGIKIDATNLKYNSSTNILDSVYFRGDLIGNADTATSASQATSSSFSQTSISASHAEVADFAISASFTNAQTLNVNTKGDDRQYSLLFATSSGEQPIYIDQQKNILYNPSGNRLTVSHFQGQLTGNADTSTTASYASTSEWDGIIDKPNGLVSGSSQISINSTTGNLSGNRISGSVALATLATQNLLTASVTDATINFLKGGGDTFQITIDNVVSSSYAVTASHALNGGVTSIIAGTNITIDQSQGDVTISSTGGGGSTDTGSLLVTASVSDATITFTKGDSSTFDVTVNNVTSSSYAQNADTASISDKLFVSQSVANTNFKLLFASTGDGNKDVLQDSGTDGTYNPWTNTLTATNLSGTATNATNVNIATNSTNTNYYVTFGYGSGNNRVTIDGGGQFTYNPFTNILTVPNISATSVTASVSVTSPTFFGDLDGNALTATNATYAQNTITTGKNLHSVEIQKGTPLYFTGSGTSGNIVGVYPADAGNPSRMPAGGVAGETIAVGAEGVVLLDGYIGNVDTSLFQSGDEVFVAVGGGYTNVAPTGSALIQHLGNVEKSAVNGSGVIQMMGEARGLPNLTSGYAWVGDGNGVPQAVATSSFAVSIDTGSFATTGSNNFFGNQDISGSVSSTYNLSNTHLNPQIITDNVTIPTGLNGAILGETTITGTYTVEGNSDVFVITPPPLTQYLTTASYQIDSSSFDSRIDSLVASTGSFATLGANTFTGKQTLNSGSELIQTDFFNQMKFISGSNQLIMGTGVPYGNFFSIDTNDGATYRQAIQINMTNGWQEFYNTTNINGNLNARGNMEVRAFQQSPNYTASLERVELNTVMKLSQQDPLPGGSVGELAVSGSALYFHDGTNWRTVNLT